MEQQELIPHLFRTEFRKITSVLCKTFGIANIQIAEDLAGETFLLALETWSYKGLPENHVAWLYAVAKNKAKNYMVRNSLFTQKIAPEITASSPDQLDFEIDLSEENITDSQLQMLFAICTPVIPVEAQIALALRILCGFGIDEIASAFLTTKDTINKRLYRAKEKLREEKAEISFPKAGELNTRLGTVLQTLYLLFNEGYYSESNESILRKDFCLEAMRLTRLLTGTADTNTPPVNALLALMCFHASRFDARQNSNGEMILYQEQDETLWDRELIKDGAYYLKKSAEGNSISKYHLEAAIAYWHTVKADSKEKWERILQLYNHLLQVEYSPIAALNRTYALLKANGQAEAIIEAEKLNLGGNHFYFTLLGELYKETDKVKAREQFEKALALAKTQPEKKIIEKKLLTVL